MVERDIPGQLFIGGLALDADEKVLDSHFAKFGRITEVIVIRDKATAQSRGYGFVTFENPVDAEDAVKGMDGQELNGKEIHVEQAVRSSHKNNSGSSRPKYGMRGRGGRRGRSPVRGRRGGPGGGFMKSPGSRLGAPFKRGTTSNRRGGPPRGRGSGAFMRGRSSYPPSKSRGLGGMPPPRRDMRDGRDMRDTRDMRDFRDMRDSRDMRDLTPPRKTLLPGSPRSGGFGLPSDFPPRRMSQERRDDRYGSGYPDRGMPRGRDMYAPSHSPPRESSRGLLDSRLPPSRSVRDYSSNRDYAPVRDYSPDRAPMRDRGMSSRDYPPMGREDRHESFGRSTSREYVSPRSGGDYMNARESSRDYPPVRDYPPSRDYLPSNREPVSRDRDFNDSGPRFTSRDMDGRGPPQRDYDMSRDTGMPGRGYSGPGSRGPPSQTSRGPPSFGSTRGPPPNRGMFASGDRRDRDGFAGSRRPAGPPGVSRGPPPSKRSRMEGPPPRGPPPFRR